MDPIGKILLVEDHADSASALAKLLRLIGYEVCLAHCVSAAIHAADAQRFDLVLCDIQLPDGDGCELMRELHRNHEMGGFAITGNSYPHEAERILAAGFSRSFIKPIAFNALQGALGDFFASHVP